MSLLEKPTIDIYSPITKDEAQKALATESYGDDPALKLVVQDAIRAENFENQKQWIMAWAQAAILYQSPYVARYWEGTQVERANVPFYTVALAVNALVPQIVNGLFYENPPFMVQPRPNTSSQTAKAAGAILAFQLEDDSGDKNTFREELRLGITIAVLYGTGIWKYGFESYTKKRKTYERKNPSITLPNPLAAAGLPDIEIADDDEIEEVITDEAIDRPTFEHIVNLRHVLVDPGLNVPNIQRAKYVIHRQYLTWDELDKLRDRPGFTIPSRQELLALFFPPKETPEAAPAEVQVKNPMWDARAEVRYEATTIDPFNQPLEVLERWDKKRCIMVLQKKLVICNDDNVYGEIPFLSVNWWDVPEAFWGLGLAKTIGSEQRLQQGITNTWLDNATLNLNGVYVRVRGKSIPTQSIRISPGKIVDVDNKDDFKPMDRLAAVPEAGEHLALSQARAERVSGANEISSQGQAGDTGHSNLARSSAGAQLIAAGSASRLSDFVEKLANQVIIPFLFAAHEMNRALLPASTMKHILSEELQHDYMQSEANGGGGGDVVKLLNARVKFSILAAAKMQARRGMAQSLPQMIQLFTSPPFADQLADQGKKIDITELIRMFYVVSDWKNEGDLVVDMTPEDKQRYQQRQQGQAMAKIQSQQAMENMKFGNKQKLIDQEDMNRAARDVIKHGLETSAESVLGGQMPEGPA